MHRRRLYPPDPLSYRVLIVTVALITAFICALFTALASFVVWAGAENTPADEEFLRRLLIKGIAFAGLSAVLGALLYRRRHVQRHFDPTLPPVQRQSWKSLAGLVIALAGAAALIFPRVEQYPQPMPDETHHLIVARNVAQHGIYASGHPDTRFKEFDTYDSVGPTVIVSVAAAFRIFGTSLPVSRYIMGGFFLLLCVAAYGFWRPVGGGPAGVCAVFLVIAATGSVYLGRSLYGEVPALMFFLTGLVCWRRALMGPPPKRNAQPQPPVDEDEETLVPQRFELPAWGWSLAAGLFLGLAILTKYFLVVSAFAFLGALIFDRMSYRLARLPHIIAPAAGVAAVLGGWFLWQVLFRHSPAEALQETAAIYRHHLVFGFKTLINTFPQLIRHPWWSVVVVATLVLVMYAVFNIEYDPPAIVAFFLAPFLIYWWLFFTPGNIPRYIWYSSAVAAIFVGTGLWGILRRIVRVESRARIRVAYILVLAVLVLSPVLSLWQQARLVYAADESADDRALAAYVNGLPPNVTLGTTWWPLERDLNFAAGRYVPVFESPEAAETDYVIVNWQTHPEQVRQSKPVFEAGRYKIYDTHSF